MKKENGITLVSLVVTIIVLIILAGVSISLVIGENGIITIAKKAKENIELSKIEEETALNELYTQLTDEDFEGEISYDKIAELTDFKRKIADYIEEAGGIRPNNTDSVEVFGEKIKGIVEEVTRLGEEGATAEEIPEGKKAWVNGKLIVGTKILEPKIKSVNIENITNTGYDVIVYVSDYTGVDRIQFPTWSEENGQDDLLADWETNSAVSGTKQENGVWKYRVNRENHNNEQGTYKTHIYLYDKEGNYSKVEKAIVTNYHTHIGSSSVSGGCYTTPVYHTHNGCPSTWSHRSDCPGDDPKTGRCPYSCSVTNKTVLCGKSTSTIEGYSLGCNKSTTTVESYSVY